MPIRILPPILANQIPVGGEVVERLSIRKIEIQESVMPIRILPPILANQISVGGVVVERRSIRKIEFRSQ